MPLQLGGRSGLGSTGTVVRLEKQEKFRTEENSNEALTRFFVSGEKLPPIRLARFSVNETRGTRLIP